MKPKTFDEYLEANGWSSSHFIEHAKKIHELLVANNLSFNLGRTVCHVITKKGIFKIYVHYAGKTRQFMTLTNRDKEIRTWHYTDSPALVANEIVKLIL
jgi:hypothetical protein